MLFRSVISDDKEVKVQVLGDGCLAGIDNGDLADVTPFSSDCRKTYKGDLAVYVRRTGTGDVRVSLRIQEDGEAGVKNENSVEMIAI